MQILWLIVLILLSSFKNGTAITHFQGIAHQHPYHIQIGHGLDKEEKMEVIALLDDCFDEVDHYYNRWNPLSELSTFNRLAPGETMSLSLELITLIQKGEEYKTLTDGHFDPMLGATIALWKDSLKKGSSIRGKPESPSL